jgi:hypothetical protein
MPSVHVKTVNRTIIPLLHLGDILATECVDDASDRWCFALADEVEVEHALHSSRLKAAVLLLELLRS